MAWWRSKRRLENSPAALAAFRWISTVNAVLLLTAYIAWCLVSSMKLLDDGMARPIVLRAAALFFFPVAACSAVAIWRWWPVVRSLRRGRHGQCVSCGYDRRGLAADAKCPECGRVPAPAAK